MSKIKPISPVIGRSSPLAKGLLFALPMFERGGVTTAEVLTKTPKSFGGSVNPSWIMDDFGPGLDFNGVPGNTTTSYVVSSTTPVMATLVNSSLLVIFKTASNFTNANGVSLYSERSDGGEDIWKFDIGGDTGLSVQNHLQFIHRDDDDTLTLIRDSGVADINDGKIHVGVVTKEGTLITIYLDGVSYLSGSVDGTDTLTDAVQAYIGGDLGDNEANYPDYIYQVIGWNRTLLPWEVRSISKDPWQIYRKRIVYDYAKAAGAVAPTVKTLAALGVG
jgi:hypothetical protein